MKTCLRLSLVVLILACGVAVAQSALNNESITKMVKAGLADDTIVAMIKSQPGTYRVDTDSVIQLKKDGVSDKLIGAMIEKNSGPSTPAAVPVPRTSSRHPGLKWTRAHCAGSAVTDQSRSSTG